MAKWGEGDPRWIVEERSDAHNVNNWHWRERDATEWSRKKVKDLLLNLKVEQEGMGSCVVHEVHECIGEASVSNRKKKLICFYEFNVKAKWKGSMTGSDIIYKGELEIPNLSEENDVCDVDVDVKFGKDQRECRELKDLMRKRGTYLIRQRLQEYIDCLRHDFAKSLQLPTNQTQGVGKAKNVELDLNDLNLVNQVQSKPVEPKTAGTKISTKKLMMTEKFMTDVQELFKTLTLKDRVRAWSRSPVEEDASTGGRFSLFDGNVTGDFTEIIQDKKISMRWRFKSWPNAHFSNATLTFTQKPDGTEVKLEQLGVPQEQVEATRMGWRNYYWTAIKMTFGYGSQIL
uniref:activator of 90 kDa heat shock protein ATPase homolog 1-like n=1 Tax=Ciona intestinalis TaxID=7719 RepID=UPI000180BDCD|nr:activator of 90 kDa heat shock protein ATPase homolog 1-like [Ciona intestinalis]|eukprot:XP_002123110.1 activator of 90 kDa heat shock protein ATPase homolog 1-like [Ciona intestinalis]